MATRQSRLAFDKCFKSFLSLRFLGRENGALEVCILMTDMPGGRIQHTIVMTHIQVTGPLLSDARKGRCIFKCEITSTVSLEVVDVDCGVINSFSRDPRANIQITGTNH